jgi:hypothetical protein
MSSERRSDNEVDQLKEQVLDTIGTYANKRLGRFHIRLFGGDTHVGSAHIGRAKYIIDKLHLIFDIESMRTLLTNQKELFLRKTDGSKLDGFGLDPDYVKYETRVENRPEIPLICQGENQKIDYLRSKSGYFCVIDDALKLFDPQPACAQVVKF